MPTPAYVTVPNPATGDVIPAAHIDDLATDVSYLKDRVDNPPRANVYHNATQSLTSGTPAALAMNSEYNDSASLHDNSTNNSRITIPTGEGGWWEFSAFCEFAANATGQRKLYLQVNGVTVFAALTVDATSGGVTQLAVAGKVAVTAGQYVEVWASQNSGGALNVAASPYFAGERTGA